MSDKPKTCGACDHRAKDGLCCVPLPPYVRETCEWEPCWPTPGDTMAERCDCFTPKTEEPKR